MKRCICPSCRCQSEELSSPGGCSQLHQAQAPACRAVLGTLPLTPPFPGNSRPLGGPGWPALCYAASLGGLRARRLPGEATVIWGWGGGARQAKKGHVMAEAPSLSREITGKPLEGQLPPVQPTVCYFPSGWMAQTGCPGKGSSTAEVSSGRCQRSSTLRQKG